MKRRAFITGVGGIRRLRRAQQSAMRCVRVKRALGSEIGDRGAALGMRVDLMSGSGQNRLLA